MRFLLISVAVLLAGCSVKQKIGEYSLSSAEKRALKYPLTAAAEELLKDEKNKSNVFKLSRARISTRYACKVYGSKNAPGSPSRKYSYPAGLSWPLNIEEKIEELSLKEGAEFGAFYRLIENAQGRFAKTPCLFLFHVQNARVTGLMKSTTLSSKKVDGKVGYRSSIRYNRYRKIEGKLLKVKKRYDRQSKALKQAQIDAAWARVDAVASSLNKQTAAVRTAAKNRLQQKKDYNEAAQTARKYKGYKVVHKGENASRASQGMSDYVSSKTPQISRLSSSRKGLLGYAKEAKLSDNDINIFLQGSDYYTDYGAQVTKSKKTAQVDFGYRAEILGSREVITSGKYNKKTTWIATYHSEKDRFKGASFPWEMITEMMWPKVSDKMAAYRKNSMLEHKKSYEKSADLAFAKESAFAFVLHGGKLDTTSNRFKTVMANEIFNEISSEGFARLVSDIVAYKPSKYDRYLRNRWKHYQ